MPLLANSAEEMYELLKERVAHIVNDDEQLRLKAELAYEINLLKKEHNAIILGHNYMEAALYQSVPDFVGDSFQLCQRAAETNADIIVFCGVKFMAETAKIINPQRTVLLPSLEAGCSLAESITAADVRELKQRYPGVPVVTYINTYADVKAECDIVCTSGNAARIVESLGAETVIFLPDEYLARNVAQETGRHIIFPSTKPVAPGGDTQDTQIEKVMVGWQGRCEVHEKFTPEDITSIRGQYPDVFVLAHPECSPEVVEAADFAGSTKAMIEQVKSSDASHFLLMTECAMGDNIIAENPGKDLLRLCSQRCPYMKEITLGQTLVSLQEKRYVIDVPADVAVRAKRAIDRMLEMG
jgi:quinolinate synthase